MSRAIETRVRKLEASASESANDQIIPVYFLPWEDGAFEKAVDEMIACGELDPKDRSRCVSWKDYKRRPGDETHEERLKRLGFI